MTISKEDKAIINSLKSKDKSIVLKAIKNVRTKGGITTLGHVFKLLEKNKDEDVKYEIVKLLNDLRDNNVVPIVVDYISDCKENEIKEIVLASCWQSNLNYADHLNVFNKIVVEDDYQNSVEAFSVIEQAMSLNNVDQSMIDQSLDYLKTVIKTAGVEKSPLIKELIRVYSGSNQ